MRRSIGMVVICALAALAGCVARDLVRRDGAGAALVPLRRAAVSILPFAYRNYLPFEHDSGTELAQAVRHALARRAPGSTTFVEPGRIEGYLRSTPPEDMDLSHVASTLGVDVVVAGKIRLIQTRENPPPGAYAGVGIVDVSVFDARIAETVLRKRLKVRLEEDGSAAGELSRSIADVRREVVERAAKQITDLVLSRGDSAEGHTEKPSKTAGGQT